MNAAGIRAIEIALGIARDNLARAKYQQKCMPAWKDGNGVRIDIIIRGYQKQERELMEALAEATGNGNNRTEGAVESTGNTTL